MESNSVPEGRFISKSISVSEQLGNVSLEADFLFSRCIPHLDVEGRITGNPKGLKAIACPLRDELSHQKITHLLKELHEAGLVYWYEVNGLRYLEFPTFARHQKGMHKDREAVSRIPSRQVKTAQPVIAERNDAENVIRSESGPNPDEVPPKLSKEKLSKVKRSITDSGESGNGGSGNWPAEAAFLWSEKIAPIKVPRISGPLKPIVDAHGWPKVRAGLEAYIVGTPEGRCNLQVFVNNANYWIGLGYEARRTPSGELSMTDGEGMLTPLGRIVNAHAARSP
jgi:hypothetical protein